MLRAGDDKTKTVRDCFSVASQGGSSIRNNDGHLLGLKDIALQCDLNVWRLVNCKREAMFVMRETTRQCATTNSYRPERVCKFWCNHILKVYHTLRRSAVMKCHGVWTHHITLSSCAIRYYDPTGTPIWRDSKSLQRKEVHRGLYLYTK